MSLEHNLVSRRHVYLQFVNGRVFWLDLDSRAGTSTEGQLRKFGWLEAGSSIRVGPFGIERLAGTGLDPEIRHTALGSQVSPFVARSYGDQTLPEVSLEFLNGPSRSACWPMNRVMSLIGSANGCKFRLADPSVSALHCSLLRTPLGLWIVDLLGPDGTGVNNTQVRYALLAPDDVVAVGRYRIRMRIRPAYPVSARSAAPKGGPAMIAQAGSSFQVPLTSVFSNGDSSGLSSLPVHSWQVLASQFLATRDVGGQASSDESVFPAVHVPTHMERGEITESLLVPLMNQFGQMQQQMLDQFQQAISMIVQAFGSLHRDQMVTIREELDQLRDLTREFQAIKLEVAARSQDQSPAESAGGLKTSGDPPIPPLGSSVKERIKSVSHAAVTPVADRTYADIPTAPPTPAAVHAAGVFSSSSSSQAPLGASGAERLEVKQPRPKPRESGPESEREVMVWLHQRMMVLQQERESRWRKILKLLPGLS